MGPKPPVSCASVFARQGNVWLTEREREALRPRPVKRLAPPVDPFPVNKPASVLPPGLDFFVSRAKDFPAVNQFNKKAWSPNLLPLSFALWVLVSKILALKVKQAKSTRYPALTELVPVGPEPDPEFDRYWLALGAKPHFEKGPDKPIKTKAAEPDDKLRSCNTARAKKVRGHSDEWEGEYPQWFRQLRKG